MHRIGYGFDAHRFASDRRLVLGGVEISFHAGLLGHSDADVLTHAVMDAVLGALCLGDIGEWFPGNDPAFENASSVKLLAAIMDDPKFEGWRLGNLDCVVVAQRPKLVPHIRDIRTSLASCFGADIGRVSVKATTTEGMGFCGREEGIAAYAVVLMECE